MEWILVLIYTILFSFFLKKWRFFYINIPFKLLLTVFLVKIIAGCGIAYIYSNFYNGGDTFTYMKDARLIYSSLPHSPLIYLQLITGIETDPQSLAYYYQHFDSVNFADFNKTFKDPLIILRFNAFLCLFSFGYYYVQLVFMCFLSMIGLTALYKTAQTISSCNKLLLFFSCFGIPSVLAWGSSILKEPIVLFLIGIMIWKFYQCLSERKTINWVLFVLTGILLMLIKPYIMTIMVPGLIAWLIFFSYKKSLTWIMSGAYTLFFLIAVVLSKISEGLNVFRILNDQQIIYMKNAVYYPANSLVELIPFAPNPLSVLKRIPDALVMSMTRPNFSESKNILQQFSALENCMVLAFVVFLLVHIDLKKLKIHPLAQLCIISGLAIVVVAAYTTPVLGTLVRIKMPGVLLLLFGLAACTKISFYRIPKTQS